MPKEPEFPIFKPRYPVRTRLAIILPPVLFFGLMCNVAFSPVIYPTAFWLLALLIGLFTSLMPFFFIREVRFPNEMVIRRHFLPDLFFSYTEFEQINSDSIQAGGKRIRMGQITNHDELKELAQRWKASKILKESQQAKSENKFLYPQRGYGSYGSLWGLLFGVIIMLMAPPWISVDPRWLLAGTFLIVYLVYIYIVPKYF